MLQIGVHTFKLIYIPAFGLGHEGMGLSLGAVEVNEKLEKAALTFTNRYIYI
jgi:hypothetical protein